MGLFSSDEKEECFNALHRKDEVEAFEKREQELVKNSYEQAIKINKLIRRVKELEELTETQRKLINFYENGTGQDNKLIPAEQYRTRQQRIFQNKVNHGFNTTNIYQEARYILEEVAELMRAIEKDDRENMVEELADIVIFAYGCAAVANVGNLDYKIFEKMELNEKRVYTQTTEGDFIKVGVSE